MAVSHLLEVFARCWSLGVEEWASFASLASSLAEEFARHVGGGTTAYIVRDGEFSSSF